MNQLESKSSFIIRINSYA